MKVKVNYRNIVAQNLNRIMDPFEELKVNVISRKKNDNEQTN